jgi:hypothetical protein
MSGKVVNQILKFQRFGEAVNGAEHSADWNCM